MIIGIRNRIIEIIEKYEISENEQLSRELNKIAMREQENVANAGINAFCEMCCLRKEKTEFCSEIEQDNCFIRSTFETIFEKWCEIERM